MKRIAVMLALIIACSMSYGYSDERLNNLYEKLNDYTELQNQEHNMLASVVYLVGNDGACQYSLINDAITAANNNSSNNYEIRVAYNKTYTENLLISGPNQTLKGGYADCSKANIDELGSSNTTLDASGASLPAIIIRNLSGSLHTNNIYNFDISGGTGSANNPSGGINVQDNNIEAHIENSLIFDNDGIQGGGFYAEGGSSTIYLKDTLIVLNNGTNGGGLYCDAVQILMYGDSGVSANNAIGTVLNGSGGGVYLTNNCDFNLFSGTTGGFLDFRGIAGNTANRDGGGIYAESGAQVLLMGYLFAGEFGNNDEPVNITGNQANVSAGNRIGGGIYASGSETNISAFATIINNNETLPGIDSSAAALHIYQADFSIGKLNSACWNQQKCNQISGNKVSGKTSSEAGIVAFTGSNIKIKNTWISGHSATNNVFFYGQGITATIEGNVFTDNGGASIDGNTSLLSFWGDANGISVANNTFVNNEINTGLLRINNTPAMLVHGNIFKENNNVDILQVGSGSSASTQFNCIIAHENQSFSGSSIFVDDPEFVDEMNEDFHLAPTSPAIDLCGEGVYITQTKDMDDEVRAWDDLITDNINGAYDAGADEFYPDTTADLAVSKTLITSAPYYVGGSVTYQITVTNNGPDSATNIHVEDSPSGMVISTVQSTHCSGFPCIISSLNNGSNEVINVTATLRSTEGLFDNSVTVYSEDYDPNINDNTDGSGNGGTVVLDHVDMQVSSFDLVTLPPYHSGQFLIVQVGIINSGPDTARNVVIAKTSQSSNIQVINVTGSPCVQLPCNIASFASGATVNLSLTIQIVTGGDFSFGITVGSDSTDDDLNNNSDTTTIINAQNTGNLSINSELVTVSPYVQSQVIEIELTVENNGPNEIGMIEVSAVLLNLNIDSVSGAGCTSIPCDGLLLTNGESTVITVMATIPNAGDFSFDASVSSSNSFDPDESNNSSDIMDVASANSDIIFVSSFE